MLILCFLDSPAPKTCKYVKNRKSKICTITKVPHTWYDGELKTSIILDYLDNSYLPSLKPHHRNGEAIALWCFFRNRWSRLERRFLLVLLPNLIHLKPIMTLNMEKIFKGCHTVKKRNTVNWQIFSDKFSDLYFLKSSFSKSY